MPKRWGSRSAMRPFISINCIRMRSCRSSRMLCGWATMVLVPTGQGAAADGGGATACDAEPDNTKLKSACLTWRPLPPA